MLYIWLKCPQEALEAAEAWVQAEADNPAAYLCRFRCHLRTGSLEDASYDGVVAVQLAVDSAMMRERVASLLREAMNGDVQPERKQAINELYLGFSTGTKTVARTAPSQQTRKTGQVGPYGWKGL